MKIQIIGTGIVGEATACLSQHLGHEVYGYDTRDFKSLYYSRGLVDNADIVFVCVNETAVQQVIGDLIKQKIDGLYVVRSSTQPKTVTAISSLYNRHICHNPEFLVEKTYLKDAINPPVIMLGVCCDRHQTILEQFYCGLPNTPRIVTQSCYTEFAKLLLNDYRSFLITYWNAVDNACKALNMDTATLATIMKREGRVNNEGNRFFGEAYGGRCLPKDIAQTIDLCNWLGIDASLWRAVRDYNEGISDKGG